MKNYLIVLLTLTFANSIFAAPKKSLKSAPAKEEQILDVKAQALEAAQAPLTKKSSASDVQIPLSSSLLTLKDPRPEVTTRSYKYLFAMKLEPIYNSGLVTNELNENFNMGRINGTLFPTLAFGFSKDLSFANTQLTEGQFYIQGGFLSQEAPTNLRSNFYVADARLNSTQFVLASDLHFLPSIFHPITLTVGGKLGVLNYTQSSSSSFAQFSKSSQFYGLQLGANYHLENNWQVLAAYNYRQLVTNTQINNTPHRLEVGAQVQW